MKKTLLLTTITGAMFMFSGCATVLSGKTQKISINSNPSGIKVQVDDQTLTTPASFIVKRENKDKTIKVNEGKCKKIITLNKKINPVFFVNIFSGALGSTTDYATGAMWKYDDNVNIDCRQ